MKINFDPKKASPCLGLIETDSIARGIQVTDAMLKKASIEVLFSSPTSPGHYINLITGEVEEVRSSLAAAEETAGSTLRDTLFLPDVHPQVLRSLYHIHPVESLEALGILESTTQASLVVAADRAVKAAEITLIQTHLGIGIGGKAFFLFCGPYDEVDIAREEALLYLLEKNCLKEEVMIGNADPKLLPLIMQQKLPQR